MFAATSHPYLVQAVALWFSFLPGLAIVGLIACARLEATRRAGKRGPLRDGARCPRALANKAA